MIRQWTYSQRGLKLEREIIMGGDALLAEIQ
jgi:hypothetical protein